MSASPYNFNHHIQIRGNARVLLENTSGQPDLSVSPAAGGTAFRAETPVHDVFPPARMQAGLLVAVAAVTATVVAVVVVVVISLVDGLPSPSSKVA